MMVNVVCFRITDSLTFLSSLFNFLLMILLFFVKKFYSPSCFTLLRNMLFDTTDLAYITGFTVRTWKYALSYFFFFNYLLFVGNHRRSDWVLLFLIVIINIFTKALILRHYALLITTFPFLGNHRGIFHTPSTVIIGFLII